MRRGQNATSFLTIESRDATNQVPYCISNLDFSVTMPPSPRNPFKACFVPRPISWISTDEDKEQMKVRQSCSDIEASNKTPENLHHDRGYKRSKETRTSSRYWYRGMYCSRYLVYIANANANAVSMPSIHPS